MKIECLGKERYGHFVRFISSFGTFALIKEVK